MIGTRSASLAPADLAAKAEALRAEGGAVLLISTELDEVLGLADRVVALVRGRFVPVPGGADAAALGAILLGEGPAGAAA